MGHQIKTADTSDSGLNVGISDVDSDSHADGLNSPADIPVTSWQEPGLMVWGCATGECSNGVSQAAWWTRGI